MDRDVSSELEIRGRFLASGEMEPWGLYHNSLRIGVLGPQAWAIDHPEYYAISDGGSENVAVFKREKAQ